MQSHEHSFPGKGQVTLPSRKGDTRPNGVPKPWLSPVVPEKLSRWERHLELDSFEES